MTAPLAPGEYLAKRRAAHGLTTADVAARIHTVPRLAERDRQQLIESVEADARQATIHTLSALRAVYPFSVDVVARLAAIADGYPIQAPRLCRVCTCSEFDPCVEGGVACTWSEADLCSACGPVRFMGYVDTFEGLAS